MPKLGGAGMQLWNVHGVYRKFYLYTFLDETLPAGFVGDYRMATEFCMTTVDEFRAEAIRVARGLGRLEPRTK